MYQEKLTAHDVISWLESACGDIAYGVAFDPSGSGMENKIRKAKREGVTDIGGWLADEIYNDADTMQDLIGDHTYGQDNLKELLEEVARLGHGAIKKAVKELLKN